MKISDAKEFFASVVKYNIDQLQAGAAHNTYIVPYFEGPPGVGKTDITKQVPAEMDLPYHQTIVAQYDAGEMAGLPFKGTVRVIDPQMFTTEQAALEWATEQRLIGIEIIADDEGYYHASHTVERMIRMRPSYLPDPGDADGYIGVYNLDELPQAFLANQNICSQLVNEWRVGEHMISPGISICATGNRPEDKAGTTSMPMHLRDRLTFIPIEVDQKDWLAWATTHGIDYRIRAYIGDNASRLHNWTVGAKASPTPRSWAKSSALLKICEKLPRHIRTQALNGQIGEGEAIAFETWLQIEDQLPKVQEIINDPDSAPVFGNKNSDILYLLLANLAEVTSEQTVENILKYIVRLPNKEFQAVYAQDAFRKHPKLRENKHVTKWRREHAAKLLF